MSKATHMATGRSPKLAILTSFAAGIRRRAAFQNAVGNREPLFELQPLEQRVLLSNTLITGAASTSPGSPYTLNLNIPSQGSASWSINWGDGSPSQTVAGTASTVPHTFTGSPANRNIKATVTGLTNPLDTTFGPNHTGKVTTNLGSSGDYGYRTLIQLDGKILLAGGPNFSVTRYNTDGTLDSTFGTNGIASQSGTGVGYGAALQPDGKILIGGGSNFGLSRLNADGSVDTTFGGGAGQTVSGFGTTYVGYDLELLPSGKILMAGQNGNDFVVARFNADGSVDTTFASHGKTTTDFQGSYDKGFCIATTPDETGFFVGGQSRDASGNYNGSIAKYTSAGTLDTTFGSGGKVTTDFGNTDDAVWALSVLPNGQLLAAGRGGTSSTGYDFALARYNINGSLDTSFGANSTGKTLTDFGHGGDQAYGMTVLTSGQILLVGRAESSSNALDFALARYNSNGTLDTTFGLSGKVTTDFSGSSDYGETVAVQTDGDVIAAGASSTVGSNGSTDFALARYTMTSNGTATGMISVGVVPAPTSLTATSPSPQVVSLAWHTNGVTYSQYTIEKSTDSSFAVADTTVFQPHLIGGQTVYIDSQINPNVAYYYRIAGTSNGALSPWSASTGAITPEAIAFIPFTNDGPGIAGSPVEFAFHNFSLDPISPYGFVSGYEYSYDFNGNQSFSDPSDIAETGSSTAEHDFANPGTYTVYGERRQFGFARQPGNGQFGSDAGWVGVPELFSTTVTIAAPTPPPPPTPVLPFILDTTFGYPVVGLPVHVVFTTPVAGASYSYDFNGNRNFGDPGDISDSPDPTATHTFTKPGAYTINGYIQPPHTGPGDSLIVYQYALTIFVRPTGGGVTGHPVGGIGSPTAGEVDAADSYRFIHLTWKPFNLVTEAVTGFRVYETDTGSTTTGFTPSETLIGTLPASQRDFYASDLQPNHTYSFRVEAYSNTNSVSGAVSTSTLLASPLPVNTFTGGDANLDGEDFFVSWPNTDPTVTTYIVEVANGGGAFEALNPTVPNNHAEGLNSYNLPKAYRAGVWRDEVVAVNASARSDLAIPFKPSGLVVGCDTPGYVTLLWNNDVDTTAVGILIEVSENGGAFQPISQTYGNATSAEFALAPGSYSFRVRAYNARADETSNSVNSVIFGSSDPQPGQPTNVAVQPNSVTIGGGTLTWDDEGPGIQYLVEQNVYVPSIKNYVYEQVALVSGSTYAITNLEDNTSYSFKVRAVDGSFNASAAVSISFTTQLAPPAGPRTFEFISPNIIEGDGGSIYSLMWSSIYNATSYQIQESKDLGSFGDIDGSPFGQNVDSVNIDIPPDAYSTHIYSFQIRAVNSSGSSAWVPFIQGSSREGHGPPTNSPVGGSVPADPSNVTVTNVGDVDEEELTDVTENDVRWQDNSNNEFGFHVFRFKDSDGEDDDPDAEFTVGPNQTFYADTTAAWDVDYTYEVSAFNASGESGTAIAGVDDTPTDPGTGAPGDPVVSPPTNLQAVVAAPSEVDLTWDYDENADCDGFEIMRADGDDPGNNDFASCGSVDASTLSWVDTTVDPGASYTYYVCAIVNASATDDGGISSPSNQVHVDMTLGLDAPTGLSASAASSTAIDVTWDSYTGGENTGFELDVTDSEDNLQTITISDPAATTFSVSDLKSASTYTFVLRAVDNNNDESEDSASVDATTDEIDIDTLTVTDANPDVDPQSVQATVDDPSPSDPLTITSFDGGSGTVSLSATELGGTAADEEIVWRVETTDGEEVSHGSFADGDVTVPLANRTDDTAEYIVTAGFDKDADGELADNEIARTVKVDLPAMPQIASLTVDVPDMPDTQVTADSPDEPVDLDVPEGSDGHAAIELKVDLSDTAVDSSLARWKIDQSEGGVSPASGTFADGTSGAITLAPDGGSDFVIKAWYDADGNGQVNDGEDVFEVDVHVDQLLPAPTGLAAKAVSSTEIDLSWNKYPSDRTIRGFEIDVTAQSDGDLQTKELTDPSAVSDQITGLEPGTTYSFVVRAVDEAGVESADSDESDATTDAPDQLTSLTAVDGSNEGNTATADFSSPDDGPEDLYIAVQPSGNAELSLSAAFTPSENGAHFLWSVDGPEVEPGPSGDFGSGDVSLSLTPETGDSDYTVKAWPASDGDNAPDDGADVLEIDVHVIDIKFTKTYSDQFSGVSANYLPGHSGLHNYILMGVRDNNVAYAGANLDLTGSTSTAPVSFALEETWTDFASKASHDWIGSLSAASSGDVKVNDQGVLHDSQASGDYRDAHIVFGIDQNDNGVLDKSEILGTDPDAFRIADQEDATAAAGELSSTYKVLATMGDSTAANFLFCFLTNQGLSGATNQQETVALNGIIDHNVGAIFTSSDAATINHATFAPSSLVSQEVADSTFLHNQIISEMKAVIASGDVQRAFQSAFQSAGSYPDSLSFTYKLPNMGSNIPSGGPDDDLHYAFGHIGYDAQPVITFTVSRADLPNEFFYSADTMVNVSLSFSDIYDFNMDYVDKYSAFLSGGVVQASFNAPGEAGGIFKETVNVNNQTQASTDGHIVFQ